MTYNEAINYLEKSTMLGSKRGHENLKDLLNMFDNPQEKLKIIHVAGTNGKGSTCAMISEILQRSGYNVGKFISPHLEKYNERFAINGIDISDDDLTEEIEKVKEKVELLFKSSDEYFSFFELITVACFNYFYRKKVDILVLEVGLGGRLDATNIITKPLLSVITSIALEHTEYLGDSIEKIAWEKGGIIKDNCPVVLYCQSEEVYNVINGICKEKNAPLYYTDNYNVTIYEESYEKTIFSTCNELIKYDKISLALIGDYQIYNACNVLIAVEAMRAQELDISRKSVLEGLENAKINGRMEIVCKNPMVILDGAHNTDGISRLRDYLKRAGENKKITLLIGILSDKGYKEMINMLYPYVESIIITQPHNKRGLDCDKLAEALDERSKICSVESDYAAAYKKALEITEDVLICTGSLYLVGDLRKLARADREEIQNV